MLHYKTVQQRFSGETMNSEEKMNEKLQKQLELPLVNGNGKGKGKAREE